MIVAQVINSNADTRKSQRELNWKAKRSIEEMYLDAWNFEGNYVLI